MVVTEPPYDPMLSFCPLGSPLPQGSDKEKRGEKEREGKEREKRPMNGHAFSPASPPPSGACPHCGRIFLAKDTFLCISEFTLHTLVCCRCTGVEDKPPNR